MVTCKRLDLQTLGSQPVIPKNLPDHGSIVSNSNRGHVNIFRDFFINLRLFFKLEKMIGNFLKVLNFSRLFFKLNLIIFKPYVAHIHLTFKVQKPIYMSTFTFT